MDERLVEFVSTARQRGVDLGTLRAVLREAGWKAKHIDEVLCRQAIGLPVPQPRETSSREVFLHMLAFTALYTWVISLILLVFRYVNLALPDSAWDDRSYSYYSESARASIRWSLATLIVSYPLFLALWRSILRGIARRAERTIGGPRRWLTYVSLFVGAMTLLGDVITLLYYLFEGELTLRFVLKVTALFVITGAVFVYLLFTLREPEEERA